MCGDSDVILQADNTAIYASGRDVEVVWKCVNRDLDNVVSWWNENGLISNHKKCEAMMMPGTCMLLVGIRMYPLLC